MSRAGHAFAMGLAGLLMSLGPLSAHHDWPTDRSRQVTITGTVSAYKWANPHVTITLDVDTRGTIETWSVGGSSPQYMTTCGWNKSTLKPGDVLTVVGYRFKDGSNAARLHTAVMPDGREMYYGAPPRQADKCAPRRDTPPVDEE